MKPLSNLVFISYLFCTIFLAQNSIIFPTPQSTSSSILTTEELEQLCVELEQQPSVSSQPGEVNESLVTTICEQLTEKKAEKSFLKKWGVPFLMVVGCLVGCYFLYDHLDQKIIESEAVRRDLQRDYTSTVAELKGEQQRAEAMFQSGLTETTKNFQVKLSEVNQQVKSEVVQREQLLEHYHQLELMHQKTNEEKEALKVQVVQLEQVQQGQLAEHQRRSEEQMHIHEEYKKQAVTEMDELKEELMQVKIDLEFFKSQIKDSMETVAVKAEVTQNALGEVVQRNVETLDNVVRQIDAVIREQILSRIDAIMQTQVALEEKVNGIEAAKKLKTGYMDLAISLATHLVVPFASFGTANHETRFYPFPNTTSAKETQPSGFVEAKKHEKVIYSD